MYAWCLSILFSSLHSIPFHIIPPYISTKSYILDAIFPRWHFHSFIHLFVCSFDAIHIVRVCRKNMLKFLLTHHMRPNSHTRSSRFEMVAGKEEKKNTTFKWKIGRTKKECKRDRKRYWYSWFARTHTHTQRSETLTSATHWEEEWRWIYKGMCRWRWQRQRACV